MAGFRADRLRLVREFRALSQNELASRSGVNVSRINRYEKGAAEPSSRLLGRLADALDFTTDFLLGRDNFDGRPIRDIAVRESFELFVRRSSVADADRERLRRMTTHERAPKNVADWTVVYELTTLERRRSTRETTRHSFASLSAESPQRRLKAVTKKRS